MIKTQLIEELKTIPGYQTRGKLKVVIPGVNHKRRCPKCENVVLYVLVQPRPPLVNPLPRIKKVAPRGYRIGFWCPYCDRFYKE